MASRVNTKFVILLSLVLGGVFVFVAGAAWYVVTKSPSALAAKGDAAMAEQDYDMASYYYSKAVAKDQSNVENLEKWREALTNKVPSTDTELATDYSMYRSGILRTLANLKRDDLDAYREYLDEILAGCLGNSFNRTSWELLIDVTNDSIRQWGRYDIDNELELNSGVDEDGEWNTLRRYSGIGFVMIMNERLPMEEHEVERAQGGSRGRARRRSQRRHRRPLLRPVVLQQGHRRESQQRS